jgi:hypothetical protein
LICILAHRGHWEAAEDRNSSTALRRALVEGFGVETDVRDCGGKLVISHDKPTGGEMSFTDFLRLLPQDVRADALPLAINVKADGLAADLAGLMSGQPTDSWFAFDMSVPDLLTYIKLGLPTFTRLSDHESEPVALAECQGIWVDGFNRDWSDLSRLHSVLDSGKRVALVSPELHRRPHQDFWRKLHSDGIWHRPGVYLCTDFPVQAKAFFVG